MADVTEYSQQNIGLRVSISMSTSLLWNNVEFDDFIRNGTTSIGCACQLLSWHIFAAYLFCWPSLAA